MYAGADLGAEIYMHSCDSYKLLERLFVFPSRRESMHMAMHIRRLLCLHELHVHYF